MPVVHAFEMRESEVTGMRRIIANDPFATRIFPHWVAVSDRDAPDEQIWYARSLLFEQPPTRDQYEEAWWRRLKFWLRHDKTRGLSTTSAAVISIDSFARRTRTSPDVIKIDVEGYEGRVLQGAKETLRLSRPYVLLELHSDKKLRFGFRRQEVAQALFDANYDCLFFTDHQNKGRCEIVEVTSGDPLLSRQKTDLVLFVPR
ncbi:MAG: FkbM family methyltransferase [Hyphomicrobium sp.]|nr:FkbM family methyltransferase [Hyphomicrobium sp.]